MHGHIVFGAAVLGTATAAFLREWLRKRGALGGPGEPEPEPIIGGGEGYRYVAMTPKLADLFRKECPHGTTVGQWREMFRRLSNDAVARFAQLAEVLFVRLEVQFPGLVIFVEFRPPERLPAPAVTAQRSAHATVHVRRID